MFSPSVSARIDRILAVFDPNRGGMRLAGFLVGMAAPLLLMALVGAAYNGGISDTPVPVKQVYFIE